MIRHALRTALLAAVFAPLAAMGDDYHILVNVKNLPADNRPMLLSVYNGNTIMEDSMPVISGDSVRFTLPGDTPAGMMKVMLGLSAYAKYTNGQPTTIDLLFNHENIEIALDFNVPDKTIEVVHSEENKIYFDGLRHEALFFQKLALLEQVVLRYPEKDEFYHVALDHYQKYQIDREKMLDSLLSVHPDMLAAKVLGTRRYPFTAGNLTPVERDSIYKFHFLDKVDFSDTTLLYTDAYTNRIFQYIQFFMKRNASPRESEANVITALDNLMPKLEANEVVRTHLLQFLVSGFESMKMEEVLAHISENYLQQCNSSMEIVKRRLEKYRKMAVGQQAPDFTSLDIDNVPVNLYADIHPYTLLIFWHTGCGHCQKFLTEMATPEMQEKISHYDLNIIGVSVDDSREEWVKYSGQHNLPFTNTFIEGGFYSETAEDYNLFATPSLFLLDNNHTILAKPLTSDELLSALKETEK